MCPLPGNGAPYELPPIRFLSESEVRKIRSEKALSKVSLREYYACEMMAAMLSYQGPWSVTTDKLAELAVKCADALTRALGNDEQTS